MCEKAVVGMEQRVRKALGRGCSWGCQGGFLEEVAALGGCWQLAGRSKCIKTKQPCLLVSQFRLGSAWMVGQGGFSKSSQALPRGGPRGEAGQNGDQISVINVHRGRGPVPGARVLPWLLAEGTGGRLERAPFRKSL